MQDPSERMKAIHALGEYGGVNPSICDSATFTFQKTSRLKAAFSEDSVEGFLYGRRINPTTQILGKALAKMEGTEGGHATASGMSAIAIALLQLVEHNSEILASRTIYGGTYALLKNFLPRFGIETHFLDFNDIDSVRGAINDRTRVLYCETLSNPLLRVPDIPALSELASKYGLSLVVDNTFTPLLVTPTALGADVVVHSLTKFVNGASDCVAGAICANNEFIHSIENVGDGAAMLIGPVLDSLRAQGIYKNLLTLPTRMKKHSENAQHLAENLLDCGLRVCYPGLPTHPDHERFTEISFSQYGYGGMLTLDLETEKKADELAESLCQSGFGYLAVSLGYSRTLFSPSGASTSSEIPADEQAAMGLTNGLLRFSIGLDVDIKESWEIMKDCLAQSALL